MAVAVWCVDKARNQRLQLAILPGWLGPGIEVILRYLPKRISRSWISSGAVLGYQKLALHLNPLCRNASPIVVAF